MKRMSLALACLAMPAAAAEPGQLTFGLGVSTMGLVLEAQHRVNETFALRGFYAGALSREMTETIDDIDYEVDASLGGIALMGDYYPTGGGFHVSAGLFVSTGDFEATASDDNLEIGGTTYNASIKSTAEFKNRIAPIVTLGYDQALGDRWGLGVELGAIAIGGIDVTLEETTDGGNIIPTSELDAELEEIEDDLSDFSIFPYFSLKATYRF